MVSSIPGYIFDEFDLQPDADYEKINNGHQSSTWIGKENVIQAVYNQSLEHHYTVQEITKSLREQGYFPGLNFSSHIVVSTDDSCWWRVSKRLNGKPANMAKENLVSVLQFIHQSLIKELKLLASIDLTWIPESGLSQAVSGEEIYEYFLSQGSKEVTTVLKRFPEEAYSAPVIAHGDVLLKNIILSKQGQSALIDWESCQVLPQLNDIGHCLTNILTGSHLEKGLVAAVPEALQTITNTAKELDYSYNQKQIKSILVYALLREVFIGFNQPEKKLIKAISCLQDIDK